MTRVGLAAALCALSFCISTSTDASFAQDGQKEAVAAPAAKSSEKQPWWQTAIFYEIYPRSFADSNNDGMGDLNGITSKLDYLKELGVGAIWLTPCYPSPQVDFGYDISDYCAIAPEYGTMEDFDKLMAEAKKRDIRVIMDLVLNHSSDKHPWFVASKSSKDNPKRDWYIWKDGKPDGQPPNNWQSLFGHSGWTFDKTTNQFYYHFFYPEQPDLNWRNAEVRKGMYDVARFWLNKGVAGFRLDAIRILYEDPKLTDNPIKPGKNAYGDPNMDHIYNDGLPEVHDALKELRQVVNEFPDNRVLIGETSNPDIADLSLMYGKNHDEIQLPMNFMFAFVNKLSPDDFRKRIADWDKNPANGWPVYLFSNHDQPRHYVRYGDGKNNDDIAKLTGTMLLTLRGTPILYYGEEIGMENNDPKRVEDVQDPIGKIGWPKEKGRDGERTPMQWDTSENAGFSKTKPWLPVPDSYKTHNVKSQDNDSKSILNFYRKLAALRRSETALQDGIYIPLNENDKNVLSYVRKDENGAVLVALNMSSSPQKVSFDLAANGLSEAKAKTLLTSFTAPEKLNLKEMELPAFGIFITKL